MTPILLVGTAAVVGGGAYMYYTDDDFASKFPWNSSKPEQPSQPTVVESPAPETTVEEAKPSTEPSPEEVSSVETPSIEESSAVSDDEKVQAADMTGEASSTPGEDAGDQGEMPAVVMSESSSSEGTSPEPVTVEEPEPVVSKEEKAPVVDVTDTSTTKQAIEQLQSSSTEAAAKSLIESHQSLWTSMDATFFADLDSLSTSQLKARVVQLATEMKDRTQWEAVRLKEFLALKEKETAQE